MNIAILKKAHAFAEIWNRDPDQDQEHTNAQDRSANEIAYTDLYLRSGLTIFMICSNS